jgi:hypothetical protein
MYEKVDLWKILRLTCCDHTKVIGDKELHEYYAQLLPESDICLCRKTFQLMVPRWPDLAKNKSGSTRR